MPSDLATQTQTLLQAVTDLSGGIDDLNEKFELVNNHVYKTVHRMKMLIVALIVVLVCSIGALGYAIYNGQRVAHLQSRTSNEVLCPLYELFLSSYHPEAQPPEKRQSYEDAFKVIRRSHDALECQ